MAKRLTILGSINQTMPKTLRDRVVIVFGCGLYTHTYTHTHERSYTHSLTHSRGGKRERERERVERNGTSTQPSVEEDLLQKSIKHTHTQGLYAVGVTVPFFTLLLLPPLNSLLSLSALSVSRKLL